MEMTNKIKRISKTQYVKGVQCPKALWYYRHRKDLKPEIDELKQNDFDTGNEVGKLATKYFDEGVEITEAYDQIDQAIDSTQKAVKRGENNIFEATACSDDGAYSRIDILEKVRGSDTWNLVEVKSSTSVKDSHIEDMALQRYAFIHAGYNVNKSILMHINGAYVRSGSIEVKELFKLADRTADVEDKMGEVKENVQSLLKTLNQNQEPDVEIGKQCKKPFKCDYYDHCWQHIPEYSVYNIFRPKKLKALLGKNIIKVEDIPDDFKTTEMELLVVNAYKQGKIYKDTSKLEEFLGNLIYPLYYLDYETINPAVPLFDNTSPYQKIPFQFSLHIQEKKGGEFKHVEFLHTRDDDPRPDIIKALVENCGTTGSVLVYSKSFEEGVNNNLARAFPSYKAVLDNINERMVDLIVPFDKRYLYHPEMKGSASLKIVLPVLVPDMTYDGFAIDDGRTASIRYMKCIKNTVSGQEKDKIFQDLKEYCAQDTLAEVKLLEVLYKSI